MTVNSGKLESERLESGRRSRATVDLGADLAKRVAAYAVAAGAAGLGMMALEAPAKADIIYTPANQTLTDGTLSIDLNHDRIFDFQFIISGLPSHDGRGRPRKQTGSFARLLYVNGLGQEANQVVVVNSGRGFYLAGALPRGAVIGPGDLFRGGNLIMGGEGVNSTGSGGVFYFPFGPWANVKDRFLGLQFDILGQPHYGWAELSVSTGVFKVTATLQGYAYDTVPAQSLTAGQGQVPEPGTLGLLALGSLALAFWRRQKGNAE